MVLLLTVALSRIGAGRDRRQAVTGGAGRVIGIVGRMGSGKSYMAVRMAYDRLCAGANVCTNFTMDLQGDAKVKGTWTQFHGWEQFAELEECIVIVDEAQLLAPSNKALSFPMIARWKLAQARKFKLDVYWISQHENRVNSILRDLTHIIYVCQSWGGGKMFTAHGYEPEKMRKHGEHIDRQMYRFDLKVANLYDTLQILDADEHLVKGDKEMQRTATLAAAYNAKRKVTLGRRRRCAHEQESGEPMGSCESCPAVGVAS
jgi:hypothetical protein